MPMRWLLALFSLIFQPFALFPAEHPAPVVYSHQLLPAAYRSLFDLFGIPKEASSAEIVAATQVLWLQKGKERWEFDHRYEDLKPQIWPLFEQMDLLGEPAIKETHYDYALVHGALL